MAVVRSVASVSGMRELLRRLDAVADSETRRTGLTQLALLGVRFSKEEAPVVTGNMRRRIGIRDVTEDTATIVAATNYAAAVHEGARPHDIVPRDRKALRWKGRDGRYAFARRVHHPGNRANRFMTRGFRRAAKQGGREILNAVIQAWNRAA